MQRKHGFRRKHDGEELPLATVGGYWQDHRQEEVFKLLGITEGTNTSYLNPADTATAAVTGKLLACSSPAQKINLIISPLSLAMYPMLIV